MSKFPKAEIYAEVGKFLDCFIAERQPELRETYNISDEMLEEIHESIDWIEDKSELQLFPPACLEKARDSKYYLDVDIGNDGTFYIVECDIWRQGKPGDIILVARYHLNHYHPKFEFQYFSV